MVSVPQSSLKEPAVLPCREGGFFRDGTVRTVCHGNLSYIDDLQCIYHDIYPLKN